MTHARAVPHAHAVVPEIAEDLPLDVKRGLAARRVCAMYGRCPECRAIYDYDNAIIIAVRLDTDRTTFQTLAPIRHAPGCICTLPAVEMYVMRMHGEIYADKTPDLPEERTDDEP